jgi:hypothetical protein
MIVSNEGCCAFFYPLTLPIFGSLDTYGRIVEIEKDANTECIEKYFKIPIQDFTNKIIDENRENKTEKVSGMFVNKEIYDFMANNSFDEWGKRNVSIWHKGYLTPYVLNLIGFHYASTDKNRQRFNKLFQNLDFPEVKIWSDGRWIEIEINEKKEDTRYCLKDFVSLIESKTKRSFSAKLKKQLLKMKRTAIVFDEGVATLTKRKLELNELIKKDDGFYDYMLFRETVCLTLGHYMDNSAFRMFTDMYEGNFSGIRDIFAGFKIFEDSMNNTNHLFMPTFNGPQYGNHFASKLLCEKTLEILKKKIRKQED